MMNVRSVVEFDGSTAHLANLSETFAIIDSPCGSYTHGDPCRITLYADVMDRCVPVTLHGEVVQFFDGQIEVMFCPPTKNWNRIVRALKKRGQYEGH